jgi:hypothetical protein
MRSTHPSRRSRPVLRSLLAGLALIVLAFVPAACGGGSHSTGATTTTTVSGYLDLCPARLPL